MPAAASYLAKSSFDDLSKRILRIFCLIRVSTCCVCIFSFCTRVYLYILYLYVHLCIIETGPNCITESPKRTVTALYLWHHNHLSYFSYFLAITFPIYPKGISYVSFVWALISVFPKWHNVPDTSDCTLGLFICVVITYHAMLFNEPA